MSSGEGDAVNQVIAKIVKGGKRVGFRIKSSNGIRDVSDSDILKAMEKGYDFGLKLTGSGFRLVDGRRISDLPVVYSVGSNSKVYSKKYLVYTGSELEDYINYSGVLHYGTRDFVSKIAKYCKSSAQTVWGISGLRGVGKTVGMLQAISKIGDYGNCVYISLLRGSRLSIDEL